MSLLQVKIPSLSKTRPDGEHCPKKHGVIRLSMETEYVEDADWWDYEQSDLRTGSNSRQNPEFVGF